MLQNFDIFERLPDGSSVWRATVAGRYNSNRKLLELAEHSENEFFMVDAAAAELRASNLVNIDSHKETKRLGKRIA